MTILPQTQKSSNTKNQLLRKDNSNNGKRTCRRKTFFWHEHHIYQRIVSGTFLKKGENNVNKKKILIKKE